MGDSSRIAHLPMVTETDAFIRATREFLPRRSYAAGSRHAPSLLRERGVVGGDTPSNNRLCARSQWVESMPVTRYGVPFGGAQAK